jgi:hypothetical protein
MAILPCFVAFKTLIGVYEYPDSYSGEPLNRYTAAQWWSWIVDWHDIATVALVTTVFFAIGFKLFRRLPGILVVLWGCLLGTYAALVLLDMVIPAFDRIGDWGFQLLGEHKFVEKVIGIVEIALVLAAPLSVAWLLGLLDRWLQKPSPHDKTGNPDRTTNK